MSRPRKSAAGGTQAPINVYDDGAVKGALDSAFLKVFFFALHPRCLRRHLWVDSFLGNVRKIQRQSTLE